MQIYFQIIFRFTVYYFRWWGSFWDYFKQQKTTASTFYWIKAECPWNNFNVLLPSRTSFNPASGHLPKKNLYKFKMDLNFYLVFFLAIRAVDKNEQCMYYMSGTSWKYGNPFNPSRLLKCSIWVLQCWTTRCSWSIHILLCHYMGLCVTTRRLLP